MGKQGAVTRDTQQSRAPQLPEYDVVVVGGGPAGLSAALTLSRARRAVLVIDNGQPRNAVADAAHNFLGHDGRPPLELLELGREEVARYGGRLIAGQVVSARREDNGLRLDLADGSTVAGRRLLIATGLSDGLPDVAGMSERWGRDVLHCPYCHGWEFQDRALAVLATGASAVEQALLWRQWSSDVMLLLNDTFEPSADDNRKLAARGIEVMSGKAVRLNIDDDALRGVVLADGTVVNCDAIALHSWTEPSLDGLDGIGVEVEQFVVGEHAYGTRVASSSEGSTTVPGVWSAGNVAHPMDQVVMAASRGVQAAIAINADLVDEDTELALAR